MKVGILIQDYFVGGWLNHIPSTIQVSLTDVYVLKSEKENYLQKLLYKIDSTLFGRPKTIQSTPNILGNVFSFQKENKNKWNEYDIILNFTENKIPIQRGVCVLNFAIARRRDLKSAIFYCTICNYKNVSLTLFNNDIKVESSVRLDPLSFFRNTDLILHSFLSLLNIYFIKKQNNNNVEFVLLHEKSKSISFRQYYKFCKRLINKTIKHLFYDEQWILGYDFSKNSKVGINLKTFKKIIPPKDRFWADPIVIFENGKYYVFIEELVFKNKIGHLSVFELKEDGTYSKPIKILDKPYHLSYPFIFAYNDKYYMIPETAKANNIQLYESISFPYKWRLKKVLIDNINASDTTILFYNNRYWLFTSVKKYEYEMHDNNLWVFYSNDILNGEWIPHKSNPIKSNISNSRQGGPFVKQHSNIYRVSQNCSTRYGYGFMLNKIKTLTESLYEEELEYSFEPESNMKIDGIHTYNQVNNNAKVFDILIKKRKF